MYFYGAVYILALCLLASSSEGDFFDWSSSSSDAPTAGPTQSTTTTTMMPMTTTTTSNGQVNNQPRQCDCTPSGLWLDVIVAVDTSSSMTGVGVDFVTNQLLALFDTAQGGLLVSTTQLQANRLGIICFAANATVYGTLTTITNTADAVAAISRCVATPNVPVVNVASALVAASDMITNTDQRANAKNLILLYTSAYRGGGTDEPQPIAQQLMNSGNTIVTVAYAQTSEGLPALGPISSPGYNFTNLDGNLIGELLGAFCETNCFCPPRWTQFIDSTTMPGKPKKYGECVFVGEAQTTWDGANAACRQVPNIVNAVLADDFNPTKHQMLTDQAKGRNVWIGLNDKRVSGSYEWVAKNNGTIPMGRFDYNNWNGASFPNDANGAKSCIAMTNKTIGFGMGWQNYECNSVFVASFFYVCQVDTCDSAKYCIE